MKIQDRIDLPDIKMPYNVENMIIDAGNRFNKLIYALTKQLTRTLKYTVQDKSLLVSFSIIESRKRVLRLMKDIGFPSGISEIIHTYSITELPDSVDLLKAEIVFSIKMPCLRNHAIKMIDKYNKIHSEQLANSLPTHYKNLSSLVGELLDGLDESVNAIVWHSATDYKPELFITLRVSEPISELAKLFSVCGDTIHQEETLKHTFPDIRVKMAFFEFCKLNWPNSIYHKFMEGEQ